MKEILVENRQRDLCEGSVNITIYDIPTDLLHEFDKRVIAPFYKGGIGEAIKDLMRLETALTSANPTDRLRKNCSSKI